MNRPIGLGRGLTDDDERRRSTVAVVGATLGSKLFGGADPVGRDITVEGVPFRVVGVQAAGQIFTEENYMVRRERHLDPAPDLHGPDRLRTTSSPSSPSSSTRKRDVGEVSAMLLGRARQAHHGIEDVEIEDLEAEVARAWQNFLEQIHGWKVVLMSLAATVLLVGGVGVLSVMLISFSDRRYEIGLRKAMGASDGEILVQFLLEAVRARRGRRLARNVRRRRRVPGAGRQVPLRPRRQPDGPRDRLGNGARPSRSCSACTRLSAPPGSPRWKRCADLGFPLPKRSGAGRHPTLR